MLSCHICGSENFTEELVNETFEINGRIILVEGIPAKVCSRCGEITFSSETASSETAENIRLMLNSNQKSQRKIEIDVFAFSG
ncbi:YgiT-type zinc finger protein [Sphaerospermopsis sp. LEGE 08334]|jgi:HTH-type transcriptional regulator/antitoxin MqsA|uniref:YgiT-type zinc finger protein n=1 Tax=Sphaerospermopsis sp. LEGE 08334 TaxID=1828651 RepID=UPI0018800C7C|nr:YgiT-type zinc finger protein [Sphaerospermopsis sp. LEGE 08334]MBE9055041.1 YgiT-type zinc finger protein [Sphaerospermopsis sp. LEGE 08334]